MDLIFRCSLYEYQNTAHINAKTTALRPASVQPVLKNKVPIDAFLRRVQTVKVKGDWNVLQDITPSNGLIRVEVLKVWIELVLYLYETFQEL